MDFKDLSANMREALKKFPELEKALGKSGDLLNSFAGYQEAYNKKLKESESILDTTVNHLNKMKDILPGATQAYKEHAKVMGDTAEQMRLANLIASDLTEEANKTVALAVMQKTGLEGIYAQSVAQMLIEAGITDEKEIQEAISAGLLDDAIKLQKANQDAFNQQKKQNDLTQAIADQMVAIRDEADSYKKKLDGVLATARAIGNDPKTMGAFMLTQGIKALGKFTEGFEEFKKQGLTAGQAIEAQFKGMDLMSMMGLSDAKGVTSAMVEQFGNVNALSRDTTQQLGRMAVEFGISGEEAGALNAAMSTIPGETSESAANAMEMTGHLAEMQGIAPGKIMKDMAKNTGEMARAGSKGAEEFGKSVIELHKMGVEMSTASKIADGLLDFESSITDQMEASVLLGKEINLDKARELALNNDIEGMSKEILKNIGSSAEFGKMNRLEQDALAKSVGMTVDELATQLDAQEETNKYFGEGAGFAMNAMGHLVEYGSKAGGFFKENGLLLLASIQFLSTGNGLQVISNGLQFGKNVLIGIGNGLLAVGKGIAFATSLIYSSERRAEAAAMIKKAAHWAAEKAHLGALIVKYAALKVAAAFGSKTAAGAADKAKDAITNKLKSKTESKVTDSLTDKAKEQTASAQEKTKGAAGKGGPGGFLKSLGKGLASIGEQFGKVVSGALALGIAGLALAGGFALALQIVKDVDPVVMITFAGSIGIFGGALALMGKLGGDVIKGALALGIVALSLIPAAFAFSLLKGVDVNSIIAFSIALPLLALAAAGLGFLIIPIALGAIALGLLGVGMMSMGAGLMVLQAGKDGLDSFQSFLTILAKDGAGAGFGAFALAGGLLALGVAAWYSFGGILLGAVSLAAFAASLQMIQPVMEMGGLSALAEGLTSISQLAGSLLEVGAAILGIGAGLGLMAYAGLAALPIIGALVGLAAVAPMLSSLGSLFGGGEGSASEDDKMNTLIDEVRQLRAAFQSPGVINMDGQKVGDVLGLAVSNSGIA